MRRARTSSRCGTQSRTRQTSSAPASRRWRTGHPQTPFAPVASTVDLARSFFRPHNLQCTLTRQCAAGCGSLRGSNALRSGQVAGIAPVTSRSGRAADCLSRLCGVRRFRLKGTEGGPERDARCLRNLVQAGEVFLKGTRRAAQTSSLLKHRPHNGAGIVSGFHPSGASKSTTLCGER